MKNLIVVFSILGVACCTVAILLGTTSDAGALNVMFAGVFGFGAFVSAFVVGVLALLRHAKNKTVTKINNFRNFKRKRL